MLQKQQSVVKVALIGAGVNSVLCVRFPAALGKRDDGGGFVLVDLEDRTDSRHVQQVLGALGEVEQFELATLVGDGGKARYKLAHAGAVHVGNAGEIKQDLFAVDADQTPQLVAEQVGALPQGNAPF